MPADFTECINRPKNERRVYTIKLPKGKYMHICRDKDGSHSGEVKTKEAKK